MNRHIDEQELRALFAEIELPPGLDSWRERIADVHAEPYEHVEPYEHAPDDAEPEPVPAEEVQVETNGVVVALPTGGVRPKRQRKRSVAVAAAAAAVVGLGGVVVTTQLFSEAPPADPTMIIDGPDRSISSAPPTVSQDAVPSGTTTLPPVSAPGQGEPDKGENPDGGPDNNDGGPTGGNQPVGEEPTWPPMVGDPTTANTGVPLGASLRDHYGNLRITTANQVVSDLRVTGSVIVDAPNVTLRRVLVIASYGAPAVRQNADNLTVENSELTGGQSLTQGGSGLVIRRSRLENGVTITTGAQLFDNHLDLADVLIPSHSSSILLRHNVMGRVTMNDLDGPVTRVTIENSLLTQVDAPTGAGSASIYVLGNRFRGNSPSTGWPDGGGNDYRWSNNTLADSGAPTNP